ncbi:hypothetical protein F5148DRAFT_1192765 [Russula earlei]|uniref:Uncharacterized protein n=1 Tax=Russula earlei TaxID=71964 RepID=A0ACC0UAS4_9AGAM|nr:hypothetical protein F5148DRAFT_1192765 [Russula earlei]
MCQVIFCLLVITNPKGQRMMFHPLALLGLAAALFPPAAASSAFQVDVGSKTGAISFTPNFITAAVGDTVSFNFLAKNHSVGQSTLGTPCSLTEGGLFTSFVPTPLGANATFSWMITVNDANPLWIYCRQGENTTSSHCGQGMVFAINPGPDGSNNSYAVFQANALAVGAQLGVNITNTTTTTPYANSTTSSNSSSTPGASPISSTSKGNGAISSTVHGAVYVVAVGMLFWILA